MSRATERSIRTAVRHVAIALLPELHSIGEGMVVYLGGEMPELSHPGALGLARTASHANSKLLLEALSRGVPPEELTPSTDVVLPTRASVQYGINHDNVMRGSAWEPPTGANGGGTPWRNIAPTHRWRSPSPAM